MMSNRLGGRPQTVVVHDFDPQRYSGTWYEVGSTPMPFASDCNGAIAQYVWSALKNRLYVRNYCLVDGRITRERTGYATPAQADARVGRLDITFQGNPEKSSYLVLATDYFTFALVGSRSADGKKEYLWLLSRDPTVSPVMAAFWLRKAAVRNFAFWRVRIWPDRLSGTAGLARRSSFRPRQGGAYFTLPKSTLTRFSRGHANDDDDEGDEEGGLCDLILFTRLQKQLWEEHGFFDINSLVQPFNSEELNSDPAVMRRWMRRSSLKMMEKLAELRGEQ